MLLNDIARQRLLNQHLTQGLGTPVEVVRSLIAIQSQDVTGAKWGIGLRCTGATDESVMRDFNDGKFLRTHLLRPTWHFVLPEDIVWIQALTSPRVQAFNKTYYKKMDLDEATLRRGTELVAQSLEGGRQLTRPQLKDLYEAAGISTEGLRFSLLVMYAELEAVVCSGAMVGKQHTLALVSERAPQAKVLEPDEALIELTRRFFTAHGPATVRDLAWWSSLTMTEVRRGIALAGLRSAEVADEVFYYAELMEGSIPGPLIHLLPNYDEFTVGYRERRPLRGLPLEREPTYDDLYFHVIILDGQLVGGWKRTLSSKTFGVELNLFKILSTTEQQALETQVRELERFMGLPVTVTA